eukprot:1156120-Pelagomonas_calceolata.AAC.1
MGCWFASKDFHAYRLIISYADQPREHTLATGAHNSNRAQGLGTRLVLSPFGVSIPGRKPWDVGDWGALAEQPGCQAEVLSAPLSVSHPQHTQSGALPCRPAGAQHTPPLPSPLTLIQPTPLLPCFRANCLRQLCNTTILMPWGGRSPPLCHVP